MVMENVYIVVCRYKENEEMHIVAFSSEEKAWDYIVKDAFESYGFDLKSSKNQCSAFEFHWLFINDESIKYHIENLCVDSPD